MGPLITAFRRKGIAIGIYFSPDDFWWLHQHHITINRHVKGVYPQDIPEFMEYTKRQLKELLTQYGPIDYFFFDGPAQQLTDYAWQLQPKLVITRGVMETPEQYTPGVALPGAWEGNLTMGTEWPWKATNEVYKSGTELMQKYQEQPQVVTSFGRRLFNSGLIYSGIGMIGTLALFSYGLMLLSQHILQ